MLTRRWFQSTMNKTLPSAKKIRQWCRTFMKKGDVDHRSRSGRPRLYDEKINSVRELLTRELMSSIRSAEDQLQIPRSTLKCIVKQLLSSHPYKLQTLQALKAIDK